MFACRVGTFGIRTLGLLLALMASSMVLAAGASAASTRYVATDGTGSACTQGAPCDIVTGVNSAGAGDEVIIAPGTYTTATQLSNASNQLNVHGAAGGPRPVLRSSASIALQLNGFDIQASNLTIEHTGSSYGLVLFSNSSDFDHFEVHSSGQGRLLSGDRLGLPRHALRRRRRRGKRDPGRLHGQRAEPDTCATSRRSRTVPDRSVAGRRRERHDERHRRRNMILQGSLTDVRAQAVGPGAATVVGLANSNFDAADAIGGSTAISPPGSPTNQTAKPKFAEQDTYTQAYGSPTIDAGIVDAYTGTTDLFGDPRPLGAAMDIGADEIVPDNSPPETTITKGPAKKVKSNKARFRFRSSEPGSTFQCKLDSKPFKPCRSPKKLKRLKPGKHTFSVAATDPASNADATPASYRWKVTESAKR